MRGQVKVYQKKIIARRRKRALFFTLYFVAAAGVLTGLLSFLSQLNPLLIKSISVKGNSRLESSLVENLVLEKMAGNYGYLFSKSNIFIYPKSEIKKTISALSLVKEVSISRDTFSGVVISIVEREPSVKWCEGGAGEASSCFLLDENGFVFARANTPTELASFIYRGLITGEPLGKNFVEEADFKRIQFFIEKIKGISLDPKEAFISDTGYLTLYLSSRGKLIINTTDDLSTVLGNINALISDKTIAPDLSQFLNNLDYIKLDSGNKVVYKMKS